MKLTSPRNADFLGWVQEAEQTQDRKAFGWREIIWTLDRSARNWYEEVERNRIDVKFTQCLGQLYNIFVCFSHTKDTSTTRREVRLFYSLNCLDSILVGVCGTDFRVEVFTGVNIMIYTVNSSLVETDRLSFRE